MGAGVRCDNTLKHFLKGVVLAASHPSVVCWFSKYLWSAYLVLDTVLRPEAVELSNT